MSNQTETQTQIKMPTAEDVRKIIRAEYAHLRERNPEQATNPALYFSHVVNKFANCELKALGRMEILDEEERRHYLILNGFNPPEFTPMKEVETSKPKEEPICISTKPSFIERMKSFFMV